MGRHYDVFDTRRPTVFDEKDGSVTLIFNFKSDKVIDTPTFDLTLDPCTTHVIKTELSTAVEP